MVDAVASEDVAQGISPLYREANRLNAKLATSTDEALIREGRAVAGKLLEHVRSKVENFEDFVKRVELSEEFSLTESRQVAKSERELKVIYLRAASLIEAANEAAQRARRKRR